MIDTIIKTEDQLILKKLREKQLREELSFLVDKYPNQIQKILTLNPYDFCNYIKGPGCWDCEYATICKEQTYKEEYKNDLITGSLNEILNEDYPECLL